MELAPRPRKAARRTERSDRPSDCGDPRCTVIPSVARDPLRTCAADPSRSSRLGITEHLLSFCMRKIFFFLAVSTALALPLAAQNTDIESLSGLQFNFGNPGARSLAMGGAFLGLADDASAAEANPAGLTILRKPEISLEGGNYLADQIFTTSGTYPPLARTSFNHYSKRAEVTFGSFVYPVKDFTFGVYYHQPLKNNGAGQVVPVRNQFTGAVQTDVPNFFLPKGGPAPVSQTECEAIRQRANDFFACLEYTILPFLSALSIRERTYGVAAAYKIGN